MPFAQSKAASGGTDWMFEGCFSSDAEARQTSSAAITKYKGCMLLVICSPTKGKKPQSFCVVHVA